MKKQIPILFSTAMVQAILAGRKTVTRRIIKSRHESGLFAVCKNMDGVVTQINSLDWDGRNVEKDVTCPYGKSGDVLYVRETWYYHYSYDHLPPREIRIPINRWVYATEEEIPGWAGKQRPSIHMPKEAARIWLQVEAVEVQRLQDITDEDAMAEGILFYKEEGRLRFKDYVTDASGYGDPAVDYPTVGLATTSFCTLWESINGYESWQNNPWVWVVRFKVLSVTGKPEGI